MRRSCEAASTIYQHRTRLETKTSESSDHSAIEDAGKQASFHEDPATFSIRKRFFGFGPNTTVDSSGLAEAPRSRS